MSATPVILVTGPPGSGKSTLLRALAAQGPGVVIDGADETTASFSGCICCTIRTDLQDTLADLARKRRAGLIPDFDRVLIEGRADPASVIQTLIVDVDLSRQFRLARVVVLVDDATDAAARKRIALADTLVLTGNAHDEAMLRRLNPTAQMYHRASVDPALLIEHGTDDVAPDWQEDGDAEGDVRAFTLSPETPFPRGGAELFLETLAKLRGPDLLRFKGLLAIDGEEAPLFVSGVHHVFAHPRRLARWPSNDRRSRLMFTTQGVERDSVEALLTPFLDQRLFAKR